MCEECTWEVKSFLNTADWSPNLLNLFCGDYQSIVHQLKLSNEYNNHSLSGFGYALTRSNRFFCFISPQPDFDDVIVKISSDDITKTCFIQDPALNLLKREINNQETRNTWRYYSITSLEDVNVIISLLLIITKQFYKD